MNISAADFSPFNIVTVYITALYSGRQIPILLRM